MAFTHKYAILQLRPFAHREELLNIGLAIFNDEKLDVRLKGAPGLLRYFGVEPDTLDWAVSTLIERDNAAGSIDDRFAEAKKLAGIHMSDLGWFLVDTPQDYETRISSLIKQYVDKPAQRPKPRSRSRLSKDLISIFKEYKIFSKNIEDLESHKVVPNMPIGPSGRLRVDFLLKNSKFHATETLDFRNSEIANEKEIKEAALANVTFRHAKIAFNNVGTRCYLVYAASNIVEKAVSPALKIAQEDADDSFNLESRDEKLRYLDLILSASGDRQLFDSHR